MVVGAIVGVFLAFVVGFLVYEQRFLGNFWMRSQFPGLTPDQVNRQMYKQAYPLCLLCNGALVCMLHYVVGEFLGVTSILRAVQAGLGLTFVGALIDVPHVLFTGRPFGAYLVDHFYNALTFIEMFVCLVYFK